MAGFAYPPEDTLVTNPIEIKIPGSTGDIAKSPNGGLLNPQPRIWKSSGLAVASLAVLFLIIAQFGEDEEDPDEEFLASVFVFGRNGDRNAFLENKLEENSYSFKYEIVQTKRSELIVDAERMAEEFTDNYDYTIVTFLDLLENDKMIGVVEIGKPPIPKDEFEIRWREVRSYLQLQKINGNWTRRYPINFVSEIIENP